MDVASQIAQGLLRCVRTHEPLHREGDHLINQSGTEKYPLVAGSIPKIFTTEDAEHTLGEHSGEMQKEYTRPTFYQRLRNLLYRDYNCHHYVRLWEEMVASHNNKNVFLSVGGGPIRRAAFITNMNIDAYPNVDIVCDAHELCYQDASVDAIHCDAVLEHLHHPIIAVKEMQRVLKKGGRVMSVVPFMQAYHGYPHHYQNYTLTGHELLYRDHGFTIIASGACQGPVVAMTTLSTRFCMEYLPRGLNVIIGRGVQLIGLLLRPLDRLLESHPQRYVLASSTFVLAEKI